LLENFISSVEPLRAWILDTKQADFLVKSDNLHEIKAFVQKIGTNPRVRNKSAVFDFAHRVVSPRSGEPFCGARPPRGRAEQPFLTTKFLLAGRLGLEPWSVKPRLTE